MGDRKKRAAVAATLRGIRRPAGSGAGAAAGGLVLPRRGNRNRLIYTKSTNAGETGGRERF